MILLRDEIRRLAAQADEAKCGELRKQLEAAEARAKEAEAERDRLAENCRLASRALDQANEVVDGLRGEVAAQQETIRRYSELLQRAESFIVTRARWGQRNTEARELANKIQRTLRAEAVLKEHDA
jgi:chromosome segregation ATPase